LGVLGRLLRSRGDGGDLPIGKIEAFAEPVAEAFDGVAVEEVEKVAVPRPREKMPRRGRGMVKTNCRWGTSLQREWAIQ